MKPSEALQANREIIRRVVAAHHASNPRIFGSVLHGDDTENSDLDILVDPTPQTTLFIKQRQGLKVACQEEIAFHCDWLTAVQPQQLQEQGARLQKTRTCSIC